MRGGLLAEVVIIIANREGASGAAAGEEVSQEGSLAWGRIGGDGAGLLFHYPVLS